MNCPRKPMMRIPPLAALILCLMYGSSTQAYVDLAPTLAKVMADSKTIAVVEVVEFDRANHTLVLKSVRAMKGEITAEPMRQDVIASAGATVPRTIQQWAEPGARGVMFASRNTVLVCVGPGWYQVRSNGSGGWKLGGDRPELPLAYYGSVSRLTQSIDAMVAGNDAIITVVAYGADNEGASFDLALNRASLPGLIRLQRIRANLKMPTQVMAASASAAYFAGEGPVDKDDLPTLVEKLKSTDPVARAEAADDLRWLGSTAESAVPTLATLLNDPVASVRLSAAAALLHITPKATGPLDVLKAGLASEQAGVRRDAARLTGLAGEPAAPLVGKLADLLKDADESTRVAALQAISLLGPAAVSAKDAVAPLLNDPSVEIDAADALGRMGPGARPAPARLVAMLSDSQSTVRWAAVRGLSQIGGPEAHPAVDFIVKAMPSAQEVDGYNMLIYLSLLGSVARDAIPAIQNWPQKNPVLPSATIWAIQADQGGFPWQGGNGGGRGGRGGRGPGGPGGGGAAGGGRGSGPADIWLLIYENYVHELGVRLRPAAAVLARQIMSGTAGEVPEWGYKILACGPDESLGVLTPHLADSDVNLRERATVALGFMGPSAAPAHDSLQSALDKAPTEREKRLLGWSIKQVTPR